MMSSLLLAIRMFDPPKTSINPPKTACGCPCDGKTICLKEVTHALISPRGMHLSVYDFIYQVTPRVFSVVWTLQQQGLSPCHLRRSQRKGSASIYMVVYHCPVSRSNISRKNREERLSCCVHRAIDGPSCCVYYYRAIHRPSCYVHRVIHRPSCCVHRAIHRPSCCVHRAIHRPRCCVHRAMHRPSCCVH